MCIGKIGFALNLTLSLLNQPSLEYVIVMSLTILQVIPELQTGGAERTVLEIAEAIIKSGGKALVFTKGGRMEEELQKIGGKIYLADAKTKNPYKILKTNVDKLVSIIKQNKVDIVHARSRAPAISAYLAAKKCNVPFVTTYHGIYKANNPIKRLYNGIMTKGVLIIANSEFTKAHLLAEHKIDPQKVHVVYRGVDLNRFDSEMITAERKQSLISAWGIDMANGRLKVLLPARLTSWKGQNVLIEAAKILKDKNIEMDYILAGDAQGRDDYVESLKSKINEYGLNNLFHLVGHCNDIPAAIEICDIITTPSIEPEAFGRTAAEAQAMAKPVIASNLGGAKETIVHNETGFLFEAGVAEELAQNLLKLAKMGADERKLIGEKGKARVRKLFSTQSLQEKTLHLYAELIGKKP